MRRPHIAIVVDIEAERLNEHVGAEAPHELADDPGDELGQGTISQSLGRPTYDPTGAGGRARRRAAMGMATSGTRLWRRGQFYYARNGSVTIQFGGCDGKIVNYLPIMPRWNYMVRLYRPHAEILDGKWTFPQAEPIN
jgi:hypothetical protein